MGKSFFYTLIITGALALAGCSDNMQSRGNFLNDTMLEQVQPGQSTRNDVLRALGTPSTASMFDQGETWFYMGARYKQVAFYRPEETERQIIAVIFEKNGTVKEMRKLDLEDGTDIAIVERETPTAGHKLTIIEQLLGNIGRFSDAPSSGGIDGRSSIPGQ